MARSTDELLEQLERFVPPEYAPLRPVLAGLAAMLVEAEETTDGLITSQTVGGAEGIWLTLLARGYGVDRATDETDSSLRYRLRNPEQQLTKAAILEAVNALLAEYTADEAELLEHWANGIYMTEEDDDTDIFFDDAEIFDQHNAFTLRCPLLDPFEVGDEHPVYVAIVVLVEQLRAAGVRWWLIVEDS